MTSPLLDVCCASLPPASLAALAAVRDLSGVFVALSGSRAFVRWEASEERILGAVLPVSSLELFVEREGLWYRFGQHLPAFDFPAHADYKPLHQVLTPAPVSPIPARPLSGQPVPLRLVADSRPHPVAALRCGLAELARWADTVPAARLATLQAAQCADRILLMGTRLPPLAVGERLWGSTMLVPLGRRPDPDLPASAIRESLAIDDEELLLLDGTGAEVIPLSAFQTLDRQQIRLCLGEAAP
jgi:hypothetical protein